MYYIAYGSNMHIDWMKRLCPSAKKVGKTYLKGYRLLFCGNMNAYATIQSYSHSCVPIVIWHVSNECVEAIDAYEDYPTLYRKESLAVALDDVMYEAFVYVMNGNIMHTPKRTYFEMIEEAYKMHDFPIAILEEALDRVGGRNGLL